MRFRNDIIVAGEDQWLFQRKAGFRMAAKPFHPGELVRVFHRIIGRISVRKIDRRDPYNAAGNREHAFDITRLLIESAVRPFTAR
ncbi:hypothetical protein D3C80_710810 [compost metagenome]